LRLEGSDTKPRSPSRLDWVVLSNLHLEHAGGIIASGKPTFPNAAGRLEAEGKLAALHQ
jgi:hypothetical protein